MSHEKELISPPKVVHVTSLGHSNNTKQLCEKTEFVKPQCPVPKVSKFKSTPPVGKKRKSRFSEAPPSQEAPPPAVLQILPPQASTLNAVGEIGDEERKSALVSAAAAAARINANLLAQGKIKTLPRNELTSKSTAPTVSIAPAMTESPISAEINQVDGMYIAEVEINDIPLGCRNYLTRLTTQENINKACLAYVSTRGQFMLPEEKRMHENSGSSEKPLYLFVQSQNKENVEKAVERIKQIVGNHYQKKNRFQTEASLTQNNNIGLNLPRMGISLHHTQGLQVPVPAPLLPVPIRPINPLLHCQPALPTGNYIQDKLYIGLENVPEQFDLKNRLVGQNYRNFTFIANQTGAKVILRGRGSGFIEPTSGREAFEAMYAFISHPNQAGLEAAKQLVLNLLITVKQDLDQFIKNSISIPAGFGPVQNNTFQPVASTNNVSSPHMATVSTYPFQQNTTMPVRPPSLTNPPKRKFQEHDDYDNVLGYQHNFSGKASNSSNSGSSVDGSSKSKEKTRRKRFTEESPMPPPPPPPGPAAGHTITQKRPRKEENVATRDQVKSLKEPAEELKNEKSSLKMTTLPFWMSQ